MNTSEDVDRWVDQVVSRNYPLPGTELAFRAQVRAVARVAARSVDRGKVPTMLHDFKLRLSLLEAALTER